MKELRTTQKSKGAFANQAFDQNRSLHFVSAMAHPSQHEQERIMARGFMKRLWIRLYWPALGFHGAYFLPFSAPTGPKKLPAPRLLDRRRASIAYACRNSTKKLTSDALKRIANFPLNPLNNVFLQRMVFVVLTHGRLCHGTLFLTHPTAPLPPAGCWRWHRASWEFCLPGRPAGRPG